MPDIDPWLPERLRREASLIRSERQMLTAARDALRQLLSLLRDAMRDSRLDLSILDRRMPQWRNVVATTVLPAVGEAFGNGFRTVLDTAAWSPDPHVTAYLDDVRNRLVGVADEVFDLIESEIDEGRRAGESINQLTARVDDVLAAADAPRWKNRARVIARTETISAYNSGQYAAAADAAKAMGVPMTQVRKLWLATHDTRTRDSHRDTDGQPRPLTEPFAVGTTTGVKSPMLFPGDPSGPAHEVIQCRCTLRFEFPEPLAAEAALTADGATLVTMATEEQKHTSAVVVALPAADDPVQGIGPEEKHATLLWFGSTDPEIEWALTGQEETMTAAVTFVSEKSWDGAASRFTPAQWRESCILHVCDGEEKSCHKLPIREPGGALNRAAVHAAASRINQVDAPPDKIKAAKSALRGAYKELNEEPPDVLTASLDTPVRVLAHPLITWATTPSLLAAAVAAIEGPAWHGVLAPEGITTGDRRKFGVESLRWRELPLPLMWQMETAQGHDGAVLVGRIDDIVRDYVDDGTTRLSGNGVFDISPYAAEAARLIDSKMMRGVSVDVDDATFHFENLEGLTLATEDLAGEDVVQAIDDGRISGATLCTIPAFEEAFVALLTEASLAASAAPHGSGTSHGWIEFTDDVTALVASAGQFALGGWLKQRRVPKGNGELSGRWVDMFAMPVHGSQLNDFSQGSAIAHLEPATDADGNPIDGVFQFTPDRQTFHKGFVERSITGISRHSEDTDGRRPRFVFMGGGPAAGKSSVIRQRQGTDADLTRDKVIINPDIAKTGLDEDEVEAEGFPPGGRVDGIPEYTEMAAAGDPKAAGFVHEESSYMAKQVTQAALDEGMDALLDGTGDSSYAKLQAKILQAKSKGYEIDGVYVTAPTELALIRAKQRQIKTGRGVPSTEVAMTHSQVSSIVPELGRTKIMDRVELFDTTDGGEPVLIMEWPDTTITDPEAAFNAPPRILRPDRYEIFLAKANQSPGDAIRGSLALVDSLLATDGDATFDGRPVAREDLEAIREQLQADLDNWDAKAAAAEHAAVAARLAVVDEEAAAIRQVAPSETVTAMTDEELAEAVDSARSVDSADRTPFDLEVLAEYQRRQTDPASGIQPGDAGVEADGTVTETEEPSSLADLTDDELAAESARLDQAVAEADDVTAEQAIADLQAVEQERSRRRESSEPETSPEDEAIIALPEEQIEAMIDAAGDRREWQEVDRLKALLRRKRRRAFIS